MNDPLDGKHIIVTGGTGFLGSAIVSGSLTAEPYAMSRGNSRQSWITSP